VYYNIIQIPSDIKSLFILVELETSNPTRRAVKLRLRTFEIFLTPLILTFSPGSFWIGVLLNSEGLW